MATQEAPHRENRRVFLGRMGRFVSAAVFTTKALEVAPVQLQVGKVNFEELDDDETGLINAINNQRLSNNLFSLSRNESLVIVARARSQDMIARGYFSHINPDGKTLTDSLNVAEIPQHVAGENLSWSRGFNPIQFAISSFMESSDHRNNILNPLFNKIGAGAAQGNDGKIILTVIFTD